MNSYYILCGYYSEMNSKRGSEIQDYLSAYIITAWKQRPSEKSWSVKLL